MSPWTIEVVLYPNQKLSRVFFVLKFQEHMATVEHIVRRLQRKME